MEKIFLISAMIMNIETAELTPKYQQMIYFYNKINCENYLNQNWTSLKNGLQLHLDMTGDKSTIESMSCIGLTDEDLKELELDIYDDDEDDDTIST